MSTSMTVVITRVGSVASAVVWQMDAGPSGTSTPMQNALDRGTT